MGGEKLSGDSDPGVICIDHIAIAVADLQKAEDWYLNLGFRIVERRTTTGEATSMVSTVMRAGAVTLVLLQGTTPESQVSRFAEHFGYGVQHVALRVNAIESVLPASAAVETDVMEDGDLRQVFLRRDSSSGVRIELVERNGPNFSDRNIERLFLEFERRGLV